MGLARRGGLWVLVVLVVGVAVVAGSLGLQWWLGGGGGGGGGERVLRAIIVDGLGRTFPNESVVEYVKGVLEGAGYEVTVVGADDAGVAAFYEAFSGHYDVVILRVHAGYLREPVDGLAAGTVAVFTSEPYDPLRYGEEQAVGALAVGTPFYEPTGAAGGYFAVTPVFVERYAGDLGGAFVFVASCYGLYSESFARAVVGRGAGVFVGWRTLVPADLNDFVLAFVVKKVFGECRSVGEAVGEAMEIVSARSPGHLLAYYPASGGGWKAPHCRG